MIVEQLHQLFTVEELLGKISLEVFLHVVVILLLTQPEFDGHREALLGARSPLIRQATVGSVTQHLLVAVLVHTEARGHMLRELHDLLVQERHAQLQRVRHAHLVGLEQNVARQPHIHIQILLLGKLAELRHLRIHRRAQLEGVGALIVVGLQDVVCLFGRVHVGLAHVPALRHLGALGQEVMTLEIRQMLHERTQRTAHAQRHGALEFGHLGRILIPLVAGEQLVGALAGKHDGHLLGGQLRQEVQRHTGQVGLRLIHVVLDGFQRPEEIVAVDHLAVVLDTQLVRQLGGVVGFVEILVVEAHAERVVGHEARGDVAGVHAARKERTHLHVGDAVRRHTFMHHLIALVHILVEVLGVVVRKIALPVTAYVHLARGQVVREAMRGLKLVHAREERFLRGGELQREIRAQGFLVYSLHEARMVQETLDFAAEQQIALCGAAVVERFDAEDVARAVKPLIALVVDHEAVHAAKAVH